MPDSPQYMDAHIGDQLTISEGSTTASPHLGSNQAVALQTLLFWRRVKGLGGTKEATFFSRFPPAYATRPYSSQK